MRRVEGHKIVRAISQQSAEGRKDLPATAVASAGPGLDRLDAHGACVRSCTRSSRMLRPKRAMLEVARLRNPNEWALQSSEEVWRHRGTRIDTGCRLDD